MKRILPKSALAKVSFLDNAKALEEIFDLEKLPKGKLHDFSVKG